MVFGLEIGMSTTVWTLIGAAFLFNTAFTAVYYALAYIINSPTHLALSKENVVQLIGSGVLIVLFFTTQGVVSSIITGLVCIDAPSECHNIDHLQVAYYAFKFLENHLMMLYSKLYMFEVVVAIMSSISLTLGVFRIFLFVMSVHMSPFVGLTLIANVQVIIVEAIGYSLGLVFAKEAILDMIAYAVPFVFVPLGVFFRSFPWLRTTGSTIIALCFTLYFIFPIAAIFTNYAIFDAYQSTPFYIHFDSANVGAQLCEGTYNIDDTMGHIRSSFAEGESVIDDYVDGNVDRSFFSKIVTMISELGAALGGLVILIKDLFMMLVNGESLLGFLNPISYLRTYYYYLILEISVVSQFLVAITVSTVLEFILIVTAHRSISAAIGGETEIFGLSKII